MSDAGREPVKRRTDHWVMMKNAPREYGLSRAILYRWVQQGRVRSYRPQKELWLYRPDIAEAESGKRVGLDSVDSVE